LLIASHREDVFQNLGCRVQRMTPQFAPQPWPTTRLRADQVVAMVRDVSKTYYVRDFFLRQRSTVKALSSVSFSLHAGEILGIVGPSGAGKSTLVRCLTERESFDSGTIEILGQTLEDFPNKHRGMQLIPQECSESLNPRLTVREVMREANPVAGLGQFDRLGIPQSWAARKTRQLSTGQRARVAVARALAALEEGLIVLDESLSGLDSATAHEVLATIREAQREKNLACVLIAHEESVVRAVADRIVRMEQGRVVA